jgi:Tfp pilus assembly protein PilN
VSTQTELSAGIAAMPRVNLMPPEIAEAERFRRLQVAMGGAVVLALVIVGALYMHAKSGISSAQDQLNSAQTQQTQLQTKLNGLASVKQTFADVQLKQQLLQQAMGQEIRWSYILNDLSFRTPNNVWLTAIQASESVASSTTTTTTTTGNPADVGTLSFSGLAFRHDDVANWLDSMAKEHGADTPSFSLSSEVGIGEQPAVQWAGTVPLTAKAYSNRYIQKAGS